MNMPRRRTWTRNARAARRRILARATEAGLAQECGAVDLPASEALAKLDGWLCDIKDMRIADGLHISGRAPSSAIGVIAGRDAPREALAALEASPQKEREALIAALDGQFVAPGPAARRRADGSTFCRQAAISFPSIRAPCRRARPSNSGRRAADEVLARHLQDHGEWPRHLVMDLWGSASMRSGGEELAQVFAYLGAKPEWDNGSSRVTGFAILPPAELDHPRIDVTVRISGLFRDVFPAQIALIDQMIAAVAELDEDFETMRSRAPEKDRSASSARRRGPTECSSAACWHKMQMFHVRHWQNPISPPATTPMQRRRRGLVSRARRRRRCLRSCA